MIFFTTSSTKHLAANISLKNGSCTIKYFSDGELFVRVDERVENKEIWVLAGTQAPAEHILELLFLCNAIQSSGAKINIIITYFGYARQVIAADGEAKAAEVVSSIIKNIGYNKLYVIHPHTILLHNLLPFTAVFPIDFFCAQAAPYDAVAAPDKGAHELATEIAQKSGKELILMTKQRPEQEQVEILSVQGNVKSKKILLVDDIISTGKTLTKCAHMLKKNGASVIAAAATHGIFSDGSYERLLLSPIEKIFVTNTIQQKPRDKIQIIDISTFVQNIIVTQK